MMEIFKIQRSQFDSEGRDMILIYNEDRSVEEEVEITPENGKEFFDKLMNGEPKIYVSAQINPDTGMLEVEEKVENPGW